MKGEDGVERISEKSCLFVSCEMDAFFGGTRAFREARYQCAPRPDEVNGKVHETLALAMNHDTAITCKLFSTSEKDTCKSLKKFLVRIFFALTIYVCICQYVDYIDLYNCACFLNVFLY